MRGHIRNSTAEKTIPIRPLPAHHTIKADNHTTPTAPQRYDKVARSLHALMLILFIIMFGTAIGWNLDDSLKCMLIPFHKGVGILVMMLACFRLMWAWINSEHHPPVALPARIGHTAMYVLMLAVPIIGLICQAGQAKGAGTSNVSMPWTNLIGMAFAGGLLCFGRPPTLLMSLLTGWLTVLAPFLLMQPAFGFGIAAARTPKPIIARRNSLLAHTAYGVGLYVAGQLLWS